MRHRFFSHGTRAFGGVLAVAVCSAAVVVLGCGGHSPALAASGASSAPPAPAPPAPAPAEQAVLEHPASLAPRVFAKSDARPSPRVPRPRRTAALLIVELDGLERLANVTPRIAPEHDVLLRRIADDYVELEAAAWEEGRWTVAGNARASAIKAYSGLRDDHPKDPLKDELTFFLASEYDRAGELAKARALYYELVTIHPDSTYAPHAFLSFAELFFDEAPNAPAVWELAEKAYKRVLEYEPPKNRAYGYAWYKLALVLENEGDRAGAAEALGKASDFVAKYASDPDTLKLADAVRAELASLGGSSAALKRASP